VALGKKLKEHKHRVRIATHEAFRSFVRDAKLEFFPIGGDPKELMSYMVKSKPRIYLASRMPADVLFYAFADPGLIPGFESLTNGDIAKKRKMIAEVDEMADFTTWLRIDSGFAM
jgi:sterol 3beta-glucosyltransferase